MTGASEMPMKLSDGALVIGERRFELSEFCAIALEQLLERPNELVEIDDPERLTDDLAAFNVCLEQGGMDWLYFVHFQGQGLMLVARPKSENEAIRNPATRALPDLPVTFVGRDEAVRTVETMILRRRFISVVGQGGMGKTTIAVAVARRLASAMTDGVCFLDLAALSSPDHVGAALATALGINSPPGLDFSPLLSHLRDKQMLIVLDSCETAIDTAAQLAEELMTEAPGVLLLVTSREPLQAMGEWVHRLPPLNSPPQQSAVPPWLAMTYPAVQLFCRIAEDRKGKVILTQSNLELVASICRRLDGSPLAIALAASHVHRLGLQGVEEQIGLRMLTLPSMAPGSGRHQTLEAMLDWSYQLLHDDEKRVFRSLASFRGSFELDAAAEVAGVAEGGPTIVLDLVVKSMLMPIHVGEAVVYRMPDMTRVFAEGQLQKADCDEYHAARRRHATYLIQMLGRADERWGLLGRAEWRRTYGPWVEDVRHALKWAFTGGANLPIGVELTAAAFPLAEQTALFSDYPTFATSSLEQVSRLRAERPDLAVRIHIIPVISQHRLLSEDPTQISTLSKAVEIGKLLGTADTQLSSLLASWSHHFQIGDYAGALPWCAAMRSVADAHADSFADITARRTRAQILHFLGDQAEAREIAVAICRQPGIPIPLSYSPSPVSVDVSMRILLARVHWIEGHAEQAWRCIEEALVLCVHDAPQSLCQALGVAAIPVALWCGRLEQCGSWVEQLIERGRRYDYTYWYTWGIFYRAILDNQGRPLSSAVKAEMRAGKQTKFRDHVGTFDPSHLTDDSLHRIEAGNVGWNAPEVLRIHAEREMAKGDVAQATVLLSRALAVARSQGALAWELRAAMTAARLSAATGDPKHGRDLLQEVYERFSEGFSTRDLQEARQMLSSSD